jgi:hypothetical protein
MWPLRGTLIPLPQATYVCPGHPQQPFGASTWFLCRVDQGRVLSLIVATGHGELSCTLLGWCWYRLTAAAAAAAAADLGGPERMYVLGAVNVVTTCTTHMVMSWASAAFDWQVGPCGVNVEMVPCLVAVLSAYLAVVSPAEHLGWCL